MVSPERWAAERTPAEVNLKERRETDGQRRRGQGKCEFGCIVSK